jgi:hypothetical protein
MGSLHTKESHTFFYYCTYFLTHVRAKTTTCLDPLPSSLTFFFCPLLSLIVHVLYRGKHNYVPRPIAPCCDGQQKGAPPPADHAVQEEKVVVVKGQVYSPA